MLFATLAGLAGLVWGVADFAGGKATQRADALRVVWLAKLISLPALAICVALTRSEASAAGLAWGALAGVCGTFGTVLFYRALSLGAMTVVAPVTSVTSAAVPVAVGLASGEDPSLVALVGISCALAAVALASLASPGTSVPRPGVPRLVGLALGAGLGFAVFMVGLAQAARSTPADDGLWPVLGSHATGLLLGGAVLLSQRSAGAAGGLARHWPRGRVVLWAGVAGLLDTAGSATYLVASRRGDLSLVAPIAALYPLTTVLLAVLVDKERPRRPQVVGLVLALAALHLVARPAG